MAQLTWFLGAVFIYIFVFFALQIILFRTIRVKQLIYTFTFVAFLAAAVVWIPFYFVTAHLFPDDLTRGLLALAGAYGSLGFSGTYIILGPISADRSISAHICITMLRAGGQLSEAELLKRYDPNAIFVKRFREYLDVGVMTRAGDKLELSYKGRRVAYIFLTFLKALGLKENF